MLPAASYEPALEQFLQLPAGWDSYGGKPLTQEAADATRALLRRIEGEPLLGPRDIHLVPVCHGGLQLECNLDREFEIEVEPDGRFGYLFGYERPPMVEREGLTLDECVTDLLRWLEAD